MWIYVPIELIDQVSLALMAILFSATFVANVTTWRNEESGPAGGRALLALSGAFIYGLLFVLDNANMHGIDRWVLRGLVAAYVFPHLLAGVDAHLNRRRHAHD